MSIKELFILTGGVILLLLLYFAVNGNDPSPIPHMLWGRFQMLHDSQISRLISESPEKPKPIYYIYKWIIAKGN